MSLSSPSLHTFKVTMGALAPIFFLTGCVFLVFPHELIQYANRIGTFLNMAPVYPTESYFWISLTVSMMATITVCCILLYRDPERYRCLVWPLLTAKLTSSLSGIYYFFFYTRAFAHILIALTDIPIALWVIWTYRSAFVVQKEPTKP